MGFNKAELVKLFKNTNCDLFWYLFNILHDEFGGVFSFDKPLQIDGSLLAFKEPINLKSIYIEDGKYIRFQLIGYCDVRLYYTSDQFNTSDIFRILEEIEKKLI